MLESFIALFLEALADPRVRSALVKLKPVIQAEAKELWLAALADIFHPAQKADPQFAEHQAAIFKALATGTKEDKDAAQKALLALMASPGAS